MSFGGSFSGVSGGRGYRRPTCDLCGNIGEIFPLDRLDGMKVCGACDHSTRKGVRCLFELYRQKRETQ